MASRTSTDPLEILLEMGVDLDNLSEDEDYLSALKEAIATIQFQTKGGGDERSAILSQEVVKVRKSRKAADPNFKVKKTKISADAFKKGTASEVAENVKTGVIDPYKLKFDSVEIGSNQNALPTSAIVPYQEPEVEEDTKEKTKKTEKPTNLLEQIAKSVTNIADILKDQYNLKKKAGEFDRKKAQRDKRKLNESNLEKGFSALFKTAQKIIAPVRGIFDRIFGFIANILLGKFLVKLIDWISKPDNQKKLKNIIQFLGKHWTKLLSLYLVFGTGLGRFIFSLTKTLIGGAVKLTVAIAKLLAAKKLVGGLGARKFARLLGGKKGKLLAAGLTTALTVGGTYAATSALAGGGGETQTQGFSGGGLAKPPKVEPLPKNTERNQGMSGAQKGMAFGSLFGPLGMAAGAATSALAGGGGETQTQGFSGGGLAKPPKVEPLPKNTERNQGMSGAQKGMAFGSLFGPLGMAAGAGIGSLFDNFGNKKDDTVKLSSPAKVELEVPSGTGTDGEVDGPGGIDKVPAMLTDGEFVMSRGAVQKYGVGQLEAMNAAGGGTNLPKMVKDKVYAVGGGYIGRGTGAGSPAGGYGDNRGYSTGSLMSNPLGALDRVLGKSSGGRVRIPGGKGQDSQPSNSPSKSSSPPPKPRVQPKDPVIPSSSNKPPSSSKQETSKDQTAVGVPERMLKSPTFRDSGLLYLRSMLGGLGGPITESQLSEASRAELNSAIARAKKRHGANLANATIEWKEAEKGGWDKSSSIEGRNAYATRKSQYERLKSGQVQVLYQDYYDGNDEKNITPAAENAKSILGQFWATSTERDGFKVVNEKYDFVEMNDPMAVLRGDSRGIAKDPKKAEAGKEITFRQQLQALRQLNPLARDMSVDVVLGEKPNPLRDYGNYLKYTVGGMADAFTGNLFDFDKQGGKSLMNPSGKKQEKAREKVDKQLSTLQGMSKKQVLNAQKYAESKGKYFSSTDGKTYDSYQDAVDAKKSKSATPAKPTASAKPTSPSMSQTEAVNAQKYAASKGKYYSSADGKTYESYQDAVDARDARIKSQANVESGRDGSFGLGTSGKGMPSNPKFHRGGMVMGKNKPKLPSPEAPMQAKVSVIRIPKTKSNDSFPAPRGGSRTPEFNAGNGSASKRKILGIV